MRLIILSSLAGTCSSRNVLSRAGYTSNVLFEIDNGTCTARKSVNSPDASSSTFAIIEPNNIISIQKAVLLELFGSNTQNIWKASIASVQFPRHPTKEISAKKAKSLAPKYFSIPKEYSNY
ncbi:hypothetical protein PF005_g2973 [Phytophthora fragariae]|uniref:Uncharacterized protein n=2 Tax=Phytophthora TaxID=4783 RepID=A0A6A4AER2_9STRA|nr:hypothetical protein PF003_g14454 [Phytophthora fragariae]KAE9033973.1 hypothetical protein PR002_g8379 [Phytophthora rubi]KAE8946888.1 hypothetical protein PF009_g3492 [Phytophthora fragariae]KAE9026220.1 hypothetical protein PF011_g2664 [Phytophthora fragariae]KAE9042423.1 hypothetical protein PR001_g6203 [Phytophthora rubi]